MKVNQDYELRNILDEHIVLPKGSEMEDFSGAIILSEVSAFVWNLLQEDVTEEEILSAVTTEYEVTEEQARQDLEKLLKQLDEYGVLEA